MDVHYHRSIRIREPRRYGTLRHDNDKITSVFFFHLILYINPCLFPLWNAAEIGSRFIPLRIYTSTGYEPSPLPLTHTISRIFSSFTTSLFFYTSNWIMTANDYHKTSTGITSNMDQLRNKAPCYAQLFYHRRFMVCNRTSNFIIIRYCDLTSKNHVTRSVFESYDHLTH